MFHVGHDIWSCFNHSGPFHHKLFSFRSLLDNPLIGRSAGFSFVWIYRNSRFFSLVISVNMFQTKNDSDFLVLIQFNTHCESVHAVILIFSNFSFFDTNLRLLVPINKASNSSRGIDIFCFGAILDFENSRLTSALPSYNVSKSRMLSLMYHKNR